MSDTFNIDTSPVQSGFDLPAILSQNISYRGVSGLLARTYTDGEQITERFYDGEDFGQEIGWQIPIVYGQTLLRGQILDGGQIRSDFDPSQIQRVYRIMYGEGPVRGIEGVGADKLQNILIDCQRVVDPQTGRANNSDFGLREIAGLGAGLGMLALPFIGRLFNNDPVTGNPIIPSVNTPTADNVLAPGDPAAGGTVDNCRVVTVNQDNQFKTDKFCDMFTRCVDITLVASIQPRPTQPGGTITPTPECVVDCSVPSTGFVVSESSTPPPNRQLGSQILLKPSHADGYYNQTVRNVALDVLTVHLFFDGLFLEKRRTFRVTPAGPTETCRPAATPPAGGQTNTTTCREAGAVKIVWCILYNNNVIVTEAIPFSGASETAFSQAFDIPLGALLTEARTRPCNPIDPGESDLTLRIYRDDAGTSSTDVHFQGVSFTQNPNRAARPVELVERPITVPNNCPPVGRIEDDERDPSVMPSGSFGQSGCPEPPTPPNPQDQCNCDIPVYRLDIRCKDEGGNQGELDPVLSANAPRDRQYSPGATPQPVGLPTFVATSSKPPVNVRLRLTQGTGQITPSASAPPAEFSWDAGGKQLEVKGPVSEVNTLLASLRYQPAANETGDAIYVAQITNNDGRVFNVPGNFKVLNQNVQRDARSATATVTLGGSRGQGTLSVNGVAISGPVVFNSSLEQTARDFVASINATTSTPDYTAAYVSGSTFTVAAPSGLGYDANGFTVSISTDGDLSVNGAGGRPPTFDGGVSNNRQEPGLFDRLLRFGQNILPAVGSGLIANLIYNSLGQSEVRVPANQVRDDSRISVVYNGLVVKVPVNYDVDNRTYNGAWDFASFKTAYTTNTAWCLLDFIESKRYGCGNSVRLTSGQRDRLYRDIYAAAQRCDERVQSGRFQNGTAILEPRYSLNTAIASMSRLEVLDAIAGNMHAKVLFTHDGIRVVQDRPRSPILVVANGSVTREDGFSYSGGSLDTAYNHVTVTWNNPDRFFKLERTYVASSADILNEGERKQAVAGFGITTEGQAKRHAAWVYNTEKSSPLVVTYKAGFDHDGLLPGDRVVLVDNTVEPITGGGAGGRIIGKTSTTVYRVDRRPAANTANVFLQGNDGLLQGVGATFATSGAVHTMTLSSAVDVPVGRVFAALNAGDAADNQWEILSIEEEDGGYFAVTAVKHWPGKYAATDNFMSL